jgi:hypothetical protein
MDIAARGLADVFDVDWQVDALGDVDTYTAGVGWMTRYGRGRLARVVLSPSEEEKTKIGWVVLKKISIENQL